MILYQRIILVLPKLSRSFILSYNNEDTDLFCALQRKNVGYTPGNTLWWSVAAKGQLISKWFLGMVDFLQKTNENKSFISKVEFIRSFGDR